MTVANERAARIIRDRRRLLSTLRMVYAGWMAGEDLYLILLDANPEYDRRLMVKDCAYLNEKGHIMFRGAGGIEARTVSVAKCEFRLTAQGVDQADAIARDPTLEL